MLHRRNFLLMALVVAVHAVHAELPETMRAQLAASGLPEDAVALLVQRVGDGKVILAHQPERPMAPASTLKLVTTLVGIERLGPTFRGQTELMATAAAKDGVLAGDLYLRGGGDGDLDWEAFYRLLQNLRQQGVAEIRGDLVVDRNRFSPPRLDIGVPPFDEAPEFRYNVIPDALLLNTNLIALDFVSDGNSLAVRMTPALDRVNFDVGLLLIDADCKKWEDGWKLPQTSYGERGEVRVRLQGTFPRNCSAGTQINVIDRARFADLLFRQLWTYLGGTLAGAVREGATPAAAKVLAAHRSRPLAEWLRDINKPSDNPLARLLFLTLGTLDGQEPGPTLARAEREVRAWLRAHGIDDQGLVLDNGSGLSRSERIKPAQMAALLAAAWRSDWAPEFLASMPIRGVDGTFAKRPGTASTAHPPRLKGGTLRDVSAVAGFVPDADGDLCIVVAFINHERATSRVARPIIDAFVDWVAQAHTR